MRNDCEVCADVEDDGLGVFRGMRNALLIIGGFVGFGYLCRWILS